MSPEQQRLVILSLLRDDPRREPGQSDLDAALDRILAQRGEIVDLQRQLAGGLAWAQERQGLDGPAIPARRLRPPYKRPLRVIRGGAA